MQIELARVSRLHLGLGGDVTAAVVFILAGAGLLASPGSSRRPLRLLAFCEVHKRITGHVMAYAVMLTWSLFDLCLIHVRNTGLEIRYIYKSEVG